ncbi:hypothetical protein CAPTEDRAFT_19738 [Capitella teleta]|uniref:NOA1/YqeH-like C-terminal domain-containing protein n=1 Tax=Capitella teleta TaxID=283909 RepID=R7UTB0_CAPTE|nr:hypothetical protein CAPTEDRAFT_19738 [Capitella teleta]|eukprot:ELU09749.1 hypothetical protein CAPTEDRAFT_19738 [Capitella teleta]
MNMLRLRSQIHRLLSRAALESDRCRDAQRMSFSLCMTHWKAAQHKSKDKPLKYPKLARSPRPLALQYYDNMSFRSTSKTETSKEDLLNDEMEELAMELENDLYLDGEEEDDVDSEDEDNRDEGGVRNLFSGPDPSVPISKVPCSGCGALLHCRNPGIQGYVPALKFKSVSSSHLKSSGMVCQRCLLMKKYNVALNASVSPEQYKQIISSIHDVIALVVVIVDVMDMPNSLYAGLSQLIGRRRPVYVIGNKIDLLPPDSKDYLKRTKKMLMQACWQTGLANDNYIQHIGLVSAKTGYGIEKLVTHLMTDWNRKGMKILVKCIWSDAQMLGNPHSSMPCCLPIIANLSREILCFGRLFQNGQVCTTLNLLKFPIVSPAPWRLKERETRLALQQPSEKKKETVRRKLLRETGDLKHATLMGHVGYTFISATEKVLDRKIGQTAEETSNLISASYSFDTHGGRHAHNESNYKRWCYDTPGLVNPEQLINKLTQEELAVVLHQSMLVPRTFVLKPKQVMLMGGLGRIDYADGPKSIYFTAFTSPEIPVRVFDALDADEFYGKHIGTSVLGAPLGDQSRLLRLPSLTAKQFEAVGFGWRESCCDLVLSSLGWVAITAGEEMPITLRGYTPAGQGLALRSPSLLKYAINLRGKRKSRRPAETARAPPGQLTHHPRKHTTPGYLP